jgi:hypothetical protein
MTEQHKISNIIQNFVNTVDNDIDKQISNYILNLNDKIELKTIEDISTFFNLFRPLNIEYYMGMNDWEINIYENNHVITFHNNVSKIYYDFIYDKYIYKIRKKLEHCQVEFYYKELKEFRYNKTKEIIFIFRV